MEKDQRVTANITLKMLHYLEKIAVKNLRILKIRLFHAFFAGTNMPHYQKSLS